LKGWAIFVPDGTCPVADDFFPALKRWLFFSSQARTHDDRAPRLQRRFGESPLPLLEQTARFHDEAAELLADSFGGEPCKNLVSARIDAATTAYQNHGAMTEN
jgi:hypothetical protein